MEAPRCPLVFWHGVKCVQNTLSLISRAFPDLVPEGFDGDGAALSRSARAFWKSQWHSQTMMAIGVQDPVFGEQVMGELRKSIRGCPEPMLVMEGGHFLPEMGEPIARAAVDFFADS